MPPRWKCDHCEDVDAAIFASGLALCESCYAELMALDLDRGPVRGGGVLYYDPRTWEDVRPVLDLTERRNAADLLTRAGGYPPGTVHVFMPARRTRRSGGLIRALLRGLHCGWVR